MESIRPTRQEITVEEAKAFINNQKAGARVSNANSKTIRTEYWKDAQKLTFENGLPVVVVPLSYNFENQTAFQNGRPDKGKRYDKGNYAFESKLLVYKNRDGKMMADMVRFIPEADSRKGKRKIAGKDFSGYVLAYDQSGSMYRGGWYYEKGKPQKRVRIDGAKKARLASSDCDILIYRPADPDRPAQLGTGAPASAGSAYYDSQGNLWVLDEVIPMPCGGGTGTGNSDGPVDGSPGYVPPGYGDPSWIWNTYGGGNGGSNSTYSPFTMDIIGDFGIVSFDAADNFFLTLLINRGIAFDSAEQQLIRENWGLWRNAIWNYVTQTNQKPDLSGFILDINNATDQQVINAIGKLMDDPGVPKGITNDELILLGLGTAQFRANLNKYYQDAKEATQRAIGRYSYAEAQEQGLSRANAFKHAMFAILHARSFGRQLAQDLANSHENYDINRSPTDYVIEVQMDLWNNQEGFTIYDSNPNRQISEFDDAVFQAVSNGVMRYIVNGNLVPTF